MKVHRGPEDPQLVVPCYIKGEGGRRAGGRPSAPARRGRFLSQFGYPVTVISSSLMAWRPASSHTVTLAVYVPGFS